MMIKSCKLKIILFILFLYSRQIQATTFIVSNLNDTGTGSLRQAIIDANADGSATSGSPHIIDITSITGTITLSSELSISNHLTINGSGQSSLFLDGGGNNRIFNITSGSVSLNDFAVQNGQITGGLGGGLYSSSANDITITNCTFNNNLTENSSSAGGAIYFTSTPTVIIENSIISDNTTEGDRAGGVCMDDGGSLTMNNCTVNNNQTLTISTLGGGGVFTREDVNFVAIDCIFENNSAGREDNSGRRTSYGGALHLRGNTTLERCFINNNRASIGGGIAFYSSATVGSKTAIVRNCSIYNNRAEILFGGGIALRFVHVLSIINCTITQNHATNTSLGSGGVYHQGSPTLTLKNNIIYGNTDAHSGTRDDLYIRSSGAEPLGGASVVNLVGIYECNGCSDISSTGTGVIDYTSNPNLGVAQDCNGRTILAPLISSDAIDTGIVDGDTPATDICGTTWGTIDLGNYETFPGFLPITLLKFDANRINDDEVLLTWTTATEKNNKEFEIEVSEDAQHFETIDFVEGAGNSSEIINYQYQVTNSKPAYYRLKQSDFDGTYTYSNIRFVDGVTLDLDLNIYPNPAQDFFNIQLNQNIEGILRIMNIQGKILLSKKLKLNHQNFHFNLNRAWTKGLYIVEVVSTTGYKFRRKIIIN